MPVRWVNIIITILQIRKVGMQKPGYLNEKLNQAKGSEWFHRHRPERPNIVQSLNTSPLYPVFRGGLMSADAKIVLLRQQKIKLLENLVHHYMS